MQSDEQQLIDGLFSRLQTAETQSGPRDVTVEAHINQLIRAQPAAPYYMAQALIVQEAALKQLNERITAQQEEIARLQQPAAAGRGSFLSGLFGAGRSGSLSSPPENVWGRPDTPGSAPIPGITPTQNASAPQTSPGNSVAQNNSIAQSNAPSRTGGFLGGALQTAAGVAGGIALAEMFTGMFRHSQPEEIINIINETPSEMGHQPWRDDDVVLRDSAYDNNDFSDDAFSGDDFSNDDDYV